ncbi:MAG: hypothetical protein ACR2NR_04500 [Solirubrobacteraceae bacterium]
MAWKTGGSLTTSSALGIALNEATLVGVSVDAERRVASVTFTVLSLPSGDGQPLEHPRMQFISARSAPVEPSR